MSHAAEDFVRGPAHLALTAPVDGQLHMPGDIRLLVQGQGTIAFAIARRTPFSVSIRSDDWSGPTLRWDVGYETVTLTEQDGDDSTLLTSIPTGGLDRDPTCSYWFSFDGINRALRYGKGEMRRACALASHEFGKRPPKEEPDPYAWLRAAKEVLLTAAIDGDVDVWRDPVVVEPAMRVIPHDRITMDAMAAGKVTVPANLTPTCQILYDNVAGARFRLNTPDFPEFAEAIKISIANPHGWCFKTLEAKASEFGHRDPSKTYLRITLGQNQGDSPGVPFVMEIWPVGHYSPIHDHGGAEAVIKVLHGAITVHMYPMLSSLHEEEFATETFVKNDVTWISARLNQVHKLINNGAEEPCITIQCYLYPESNETHWPYFDYLDGTKIAYFDPNSDMDYVEFKATMKKEWDALDRSAAAGS